MSSWRMQYWSLKLLGLGGLTLMIFALAHLRSEVPRMQYQRQPANLQQRPNRISDFGVDRSLPLQYVRWMQRLVMGQWGMSRFYEQPVLRYSAKAAGHTTVILAWTAVAFGLWLALYRGFRRLLPRSHPSSGDRLALLFVAALPNFVVALIARDLLIWHAGWLSLAHVSVFAPSYSLNPVYMLLPAAVLALSLGAVWQALNQMSVLAHARQRSRNWRVSQFCRSVLPILPILLLQLFLTEYVLSIPGLGSLGLQALRRRDIPMLQGFFVCTCILYFALQLMLEWGARSRRRGRSPLACIASASRPRRASRRGLYRGLFGLGLLLAIAVWAHRLAPFDANELHSGAQLRQPGYRYILGTDFLGRDILSRTLDGFRSAIPHTLLITAITGAMASLSLALARFLPRFARQSLRVGAVAIHTIPPFILVFMIFLMLEPHRLALEIALACGFLPLASQWLNLKGPIFTRVVSLAQIGSQLLILGIVFSFLNLTPDASLPTWGSDIRHGLSYSQRNIWLILAPSLALIWSHYNFHLVSHYLPAEARPSAIEARRRQNAEVPTTAKDR